jgi:hypothetical protein
LIFRTQISSKTLDEHWTTWIVKAIKRHHSHLKGTS